MLRSGTSAALYCFKRSKFISNSIMSSWLTRPLEVLFEDEHFVAINKPANILSVPGNGEASLLVRLPRKDQWSAAIVAAKYSKTIEMSEAARSMLSELAFRHNVPRRHQQFVSFTKRSLTVHDDGAIEEAWNAVTTADRLLHTVPYEKIKDEDMSIQTLLSKQYGTRVYPVHRLDLETTGILLFAKTASAAGSFGRQFRERLVSGSNVF
jgi:23S rRNA-/tRNA-specific pseudouridylate synthase